MAKKAEDQSTELEVAGAAGLPAELMEQFQSDAGQGVSTSTEDTMIPLLSMVQKGSPQVDKTHQRYNEMKMEGIEAGDFLMGSTRTFWKGEKGLLFVPVFFEHSFNRWRPREEGGGFMGSFETLPDEATEWVDPERPTRRAYRMPDDSELIEVRNHYGLIVNGPEALPVALTGASQAVLTLSSTGHTFSRQWMTQISQIRLPSGDLAPSRSRMWQITNVIKTNSTGSWYGYKAEDRGWVGDKTLYTAATNMFRVIKEGKLKAAAPTAPPTDREEREVPF